MTINKIISICIPTYNNEEYIAKTIRSVFNQTYQDFEIIISDDASTDRTIEIVQSFNDSRIKIFNHEVNEGLSSNWNRSIDLARGDYIKLVCGDDILYPTCIEKQMRILDNDTNLAIALVTSYSHVINSIDNVIFKRKSIFHSGENNSKKVMKKCIRMGSNFIGEPMVGMFRRASLHDDLKFDGSNPHMIDLDFWFKLFEKGNLYIINDYLSAFRVSSGSISASLNIKQFILFKDFIDLQRRKNRISTFDQRIGIFNAFFVSLIRNFIFQYIITKDSRRRYEN
jgi:glycosyltransferase involved in cell wall biosynthesis